MEHAQACPRQRSERGTHIAESQASLVDKDHVVEVEHVDLQSLSNSRGYCAIKRVFDVTACGIALVLLSPVMLGVSIAIKIDSPGPVIFRQERLGKGGKPFMIHKFRSMRTDAEADGARWAAEDDPRITRVGRFIRKSRLDELPQFYDVVIGNMSLVGPRPERAVFYKEFEQYVHGFSQRLLVTPGITGLAQVMGGYDLMPAEKVTWDIKYMKERSVVLDLKIMLRTLQVMVMHEGAR